MYIYSVTLVWKEKALNVLRALGLEEKADSLPNQLSGGERQRVAISESCGKATLTPRNG